MEDKILTCVDCNREFTDYADDQAYRAQRGWSETPKRCKECRRKKKEMIQKQRDY